MSTHEQNHRRYPKSHNPYHRQQRSPSSSSHAELQHILLLQKSAVSHQFPFLRVTASRFPNHQRYTKTKGERHSYLHEHLYHHVSVLPGRQQKRGSDTGAWVKGFPRGLLQRKPTRMVAALVKYALTHKSVRQPRYELDMLHVCGMSCLNHESPFLKYPLPL